MKLEVNGLTKSFGSKVVLKDVSFSIRDNEIFGLLGPNGAGKTTMIRIILNILKEDSGEVRVFGKPFSEGIKNKIGYLPEEGSLYKDNTVYEVIRYFASLKGMENPDARIDEMLRKFGLYKDREKKISELSKGMQRKVLFIVSVIHEPDVLILDEPFSGLDPINKKLVKDIILEFKERGITIIMSTHQMAEVEKMCDRMLMINNGRKVLYGGLSGIKKKYGFSVFVDYRGRLPKLREIKKADDYGSHAELVLEKGADTQQVLKKLAARVEIKRFEVKTRSLSEIFIDVVQNK